MTPRAIEALSALLPTRHGTSADRAVLERLAALGDDDWFVRGGARRALTQHG